MAADVRTPRPTHWAKTMLLLVAGLLSLILIAQAAILFGSDEKTARGIQAAAAILNVVFAGMLALVATKQQELQKKQQEDQSSIREATVSLARLQAEIAARDAAVFRVHDLARGVTRTFAPHGQVTLDFSVYNQGHRDSALLSAHVIAVRDGNDVHGWQLSHVQRVGPADPNDLMVRGGDYVRLRGVLHIPSGTDLTGLAYRLRARPVLEGANSVGETWFPQA